MIEYEGNKELVYSDKGTGDIFGDVLRRRISRRDALKTGIAASSVVFGLESLGEVSAQDATPAAGAGPVFDAVGDNETAEMTVAAGYKATPFLKWGDPLFADAPAFDVANQSAAAQEKQFGYNCDFVGFIPLPLGSDSSDHGLMIVNHEYTNPEMMFAGYLVKNPEWTEGAEDIDEFIPSPTPAIIDTELAAHGVTVVEIMRGADGTWATVLDSQYNRRITGTTPITVSGPAAGNDWLKTSADPTGTAVVGTLNNCAGGITPWGTFVSGEENFQQYFANLEAVAEGPVQANHARYGLAEGPSQRLWEQVYDRFDLAKEPNEPFRFGWAVEIDPFDPASTPKKRTALGRNKHEGHTSVISAGGNAVIYSGDDERFDYAYKFVSAGTYNADDRAANLDLLDEGTLYVAKFNDDGTGAWIPLIFGEGPLTAENGFDSQGAVLVNTRLAADLLGATKMDRPEDFETNPVTGTVYLVCTNNTNRGAEGRDPVNNANPRPENANGHIIEINEAGGDHAATTFEWDIFLLCGDPTDESTYFAGYPKEKVSAISSPDNITFDLAGNLWISTDGMPNNLPSNDGLYAVPVAGAERGNLKRFFTCVAGAEVSGPVFTPDNSSLFTSVQHPGEGGTFEQQLSTWPDGTGAPRPTVVVIQAENGGRVGA
jgi:secreted PhoX family phosphatase